MSGFKQKLLKVVCENATVEFMNNTYSCSNAPSEDDIVAGLVASAPLHGLTYLGKEEGVVSFSTYSKSAVESFALYLDTNEYIDIYDISAAVTDPLTKESNIKNDFDFDTTRESEFIEYFIDVALFSEYTDYNDVYTIGDEEEDEDYFSYPMDDSETNDYIRSDETPLLIKLASTLSKSNFGKFSVTMHPKDKSKILIQCNYSEIPALEDVEYDLETLNGSNFGPTFSEEFELVNQAVYNENETSTSSAVYQAINTDDASTILECLDEVDELYTDMYLSEIRKVIKVNSKGKKRIKMQCQPGFKYSHSRMACIKITGSELAQSRIAHRQMSRTKKSLGNSYKTRITIKFRKAKRFRKMMGI